jgi:addiction module RelE/StbE family toxin
MKLIWQPQALEDLRSVRKHIAADSPTAASRVVGRIVALVSEQLTSFPEAGRAGRVAGTRELVVAKTPYIAVYRIAGENIDILAVHHAARRWPERF